MYWFFRMFQGIAVTRMDYNSGNQWIKIHCLQQKNPLPSAKALTEPTIWSEKKAGRKVETVSLHNLFIDLTSEDPRMIWNFTGSYILHSLPLE